MNIMEEKYHRSLNATGRGRTHNTNNIFNFKWAVARWQWL
jgi:hypothetical protein